MSTSLTPTDMVYIYSPHPLPRLAYVASHIFRNILGTEFMCTTDKNFFLNQEGVCINYSDEKLNKGIHIFPQGLLSKTGIQPISDLQPGEWEGLFCFFYQKKAEIPFDLFAASFYLLTCYEEFFPKQLDQHQRFDYRESLAFQYGFLEIPLVDRWAYLLKNTLEKAGYDTCSFKKRTYRVVSTFDIDHPYLYRNKGIVKNTMGALRDLFKGKLSLIGERIRVLFHLQKDPYLESLHWIDRFHKNSGYTYSLFILISRYGKYGRTTLYPQRTYFDYLRSLRQVEFGLHPSYESHLNQKRLRKEKQKLESILKQNISICRQHFLRLKNPETFQLLDQYGFTEDFTLTFAQAPGFRSGTAIPYPFYDISSEKETSLLIRPTIVMDTTLISHLKMNPEEALQKIKKLIDACKQSGGDYLMLWHNSNLAGQADKNPWIQVFTTSHQYAISISYNIH